ncbi:MAG: cyclic 2,3-diphosphoglycerate synthase [Acidobacteriota bacterium]
MGAAGRDFHNFNTVFRDDEAFEVVAFTATQIPNIDGRRYPAGLAGRLYPDGIPIHAESELPALVRRHGIDVVVFAYSDVPHTHVMHQASVALAHGADFWLIGPGKTMLAARIPVVSVCAVRTGCGKSQTTRRVIAILRAKGRRVVAVRHPMPYGDLEKQRVQRFGSMEDLERHGCTIEEREEYEPHIAAGVTVFAGVDYQAILDAASAEADVIVWDGGNNDLPFFRPDVEIVVTDPLRAGHELSYHPGEANLRRAGAVVINKIGSADAASVDRVRESIRSCNPGAIVVEAASPIHVDDSAAIRGKRVLVVEDGPTLTHGEMAWGAGVAAARKFGAAELCDIRSVARGSIAAVFQKYPHVGPLLPAMGYDAKQVEELKATIEASGAELVLVATPIDLRRLLHLEIPAMRVTYELQEIGSPTLDDVLAPVLR